MVKLAFARLFPPFNLLIWMCRYLMLWPRRSGDWLY